MSNQSLQSSHTHLGPQESTIYRLRAPLNRMMLGLALCWLVLIGLTLNSATDDFKIFRQVAVNMLQTGDPYVAGPGQGASAAQPQDEISKVQTSAYYYPPPFAYLMQPFGLLPQEQGQVIWYLVNCVLLGLLIAVCIRISGSVLAYRYWGLVVFGMVIAPPTRLSLQLGQISILLALTLVATFALAERHNKVTGLLLALASLIKIYPALLGLYYLLRRLRSVVAWTALMGALLLILSILLYGITPYLSYVRSLLLLNGHYPHAAEHNMSLAGFWSRLLVESQYGIPIANLPLLASALLIASGLAVLGVCVWIGRGAADSLGMQLQFSLWLCGMMLLSPANGSYNLVLLLLPLLAMLRYLEQHLDRTARAWLILGTALACIPPGWSNWLPSVYNTVHTGWGLLLLTPAFYGLLAYLGLLAWLARRHALRDEPSAAPTTH